MQLNCCNRDRDTGLQPIFLKINLEAGNRSVLNQPIFARVGI